MKTFQFGLVLLCLMVVNCSSNSQKNVALDEKSSGINFTISVQQVFAGADLPALQGSAWARDNNRILLIGGRKEGMHQQVNLNQVFSTTESNDSIWVIDLTLGKAWGMPVPDDYRFQFSSSNMLYCQVEDTLYLAGGFGTRPGDTSQLNYTIDRISAVRVSTLIQKVMNGESETELKKEILFNIKDSLVQVTGGEMRSLGNTFYLIMGQNYETRYSPGVTGTYTEEVRTFEIINHQGNYSIANRKIVKDSETPSRLHRRDLNVTSAIRRGMPAFTAYGGVFTPDGQGWLHPIYLDIDSNNQLQITSDTFKQTMNNYNCAVVSIYDAKNQINYHSFLGGISYQQYDSISGDFKVGDHGIPLPFIKTILTLARFDSGVTHARVQIPPDDAILPTYLGAQAIFIPDLALLYQHDLLDLAKLENKSASTLGFMYGGIRATAPSYSSATPTYASNSIYKVIFNPD